jgi:DnaJ-class molecular chaperone
MRTYQDAVFDLLEHARKQLRDSQIDNLRTIALLEGQKGQTRRAHEQGTRVAKDLRLDNELLMDQIKSLHLEYVKDDCDTCLGSGEVDDTALSDYPSRLNEYEPAEVVVRVVCEDCRGTGKEWI